jgi:hypothetical protein
MQYPRDQKGANAMAGLNCEKFTLGLRAVPSVFEGNMIDRPHLRSARRLLGRG